MAELEINFDPFISLRRQVRTPLTNPLHLVSFIEAAGVPGLSYTYHPEADDEDDLALLPSMTGSRINVRVFPDAESIEKVLSLKPDMITLIGKDGHEHALEMTSVNLKELLEPILAKEEFAVSVRVRPDVRELKLVYQLGVDEVEIATNHLAGISSHAGFVRQLSQLVHIIRVGQKNNLAISVGGNLDRRLITELLKVVDLDFISVDDALLSQALMLGFENALQNLIECME